MNRLQKRTGHTEKEPTEIIAVKEKKEIPKNNDDIQAALEAMGYGGEGLAAEDLPLPAFIENDGEPLELPHRYTLFTAYEEYGLREGETIAEAIDRNAKEVKSKSITRHN